MIFINNGHSLEASTKESRITIKIGEELKKIMPDAVFVPDNLDLKESIAWINYRTNKLDFAVGIHTNWNSDSSIRGTEGYYAHDSKNASIMSKHIAKALGIPNRGAKHDSQTYVGSLGFLRQLNCPSVIVEVCYLSNEKDMEAFENDGIRKAAIGIKNGIDEILGKKKKISLLLKLIELYKKIILLLRSQRLAFIR